MLLSPGYRYVGLGLSTSKCVWTKYLPVYMALTRHWEAKLDEPMKYPSRKYTSNRKNPPYRGRCPPKEVGARVHAGREGMKIPPLLSCLRGNLINTRSQSFKEPMTSYRTDCYTKLAWRAQLFQIEQYWTMPGRVGSSRQISRIYGIQY